LHADVVIVVQARLSMKDTLGRVYKTASAIV